MGFANGIIHRFVNPIEEWQEIGLLAIGGDGHVRGGDVEHDGELCGFWGLGDCVLEAAAKGIDIAIISCCCDQP
jgi:hypothetical protein